MGAGYALVFGYSEQEEAEMTSKEQSATGVTQPRHGTTRSRQTTARTQRDAQARGYT
jgi:hypothetical protein